MLSRLASLTRRQVPNMIIRQMSSATESLSKMSPEKLRQNFEQALRDPERTKQLMSDISNIPTDIPTDIPTEEFQQNFKTMQNKYYSDVLRAVRPLDDKTAFLYQTIESMHNKDDQSTTAELKKSTIDAVNNDRKQRERQKESQEIRKKIIEDRINKNELKLNLNYKDY